MSRRITAGMTHRTDHHWLSRNLLLKKFVIEHVLLEDSLSGLCIEEVNVISIHMQGEFATCMCIRTWIDTSNHCFTTNSQVDQQFTPQVFNDLYRSFKRRATF